MLINKLKSRLSIVLNIHFLYYKRNFPLDLNTHVSELQNQSNKLKKHPTACFEQTSLLITKVAE